MTPRQHAAHITFHSLAESARQHVLDGLPGPGSARVMLNDWYVDRLVNDESIDADSVVDYDKRHSKNYYEFFGAENPSDRPTLDKETV